MEGDAAGIQVGTASATLVRKADHEPAESVGFRAPVGTGQLTESIVTAEAEPDTLYSGVELVLFGHGPLP